MNTAALSVELLQISNSAEAILQQVSAEESRAPVLPGGWSRRHVLGHLIDSASNNHQRFVRASLAGSLDFPAYDQSGWSRAQASGETDWPLLVALWTSYNRYLAYVIAHLPASKLQVSVRIGRNEPVTLGFIAQDYLTHLVHHLRQIGAASEGD